MRILVVKAFHATQQGDMQAEDFENSVRGAFRRVYSADTSPNEFVSARLGDLWEYVYLAGTEYTNVAAQAKFDSLDAVVIDGSSALMPWDAAAWPLLVLVKLCMVHKKFTLAAGPGNLCAAFVCATGGRKMHVVHCGPLDVGEELQPAESEWDDVEDVLVDQATGDYYTYNWNTVTWVPQGNGGIYHYRAAQRSRSVRSSYENNSPRFAGPKAVHRRFVNQRRPDDPKSQPLGAPRGQAIVRIRPNAGASWRGFAGFENNDFNVELASDWCLHETANRSNYHKYLVTAESESGPLCYQFNNLWGLGFHVTARYVASVMVVRNFAVWMTELIAGQRGGVTSARQQSRVVEFDRGNILVGYGSNLAPSHADDVTSMDNALHRNTHAGFATARSGRPIRCRHGIKHESKVPKPPVDKLWRHVWEFALSEGLDETVRRFAARDERGWGSVNEHELRHVLLDCIGKSVPKERIEDIMQEAIEIIEDMQDNGAERKRDGTSARPPVETATAGVSKLSLDYTVFLDSLRLRFLYDGRLKKEEEAKRRSSRQQRESAEDSRTATKSHTSHTQPVNRGSRLGIIAKRLGVALPTQPSEEFLKSGRRGSDEGCLQPLRAEDESGLRAGVRAGDSKELSKPKLPHLDLTLVPGSQLERASSSAEEAPHEITDVEIANGTGVKFSGGVPFAVPRAIEKVIRNRSPARPHSNYRKFVNMRMTRHGESPRVFKNGRDTKEFVPIVDDRTLFMTAEERLRLEEAQSKKTWIGKAGFQATFGKRSVMPLPDDFGVRASGPYFTDPREPYKKHDHKEKWTTPGVDMNLAGAGANIGIDLPQLDEMTCRVWRR
jgi:hypothetical protein